jgi:hypothetical protein
MTTTTTRTAAYGHPQLPARQVVWTRLGNAMGYTNTEPKRTEIRDALDTMTWTDPAELADQLDGIPGVLARAIADLYYGRVWALDCAGVAALPDDSLGQTRRLVGLRSVTGERYVLLHAGYELIHLYTDHPATGTGVPS